MPESCPVKDEAAGTRGYCQFLALLSERHKFGSNLGVLTHKAGGDQVSQRRICLLPVGEGGVEFYIWVGATACMP